MLREFSFIGGYPLFYLSNNDNCLCSECATHAGLTERHSHVNWEAEVFCDECSAEIESAYGD